MIDTMVPPEDIDSAVSVIEEEADMHEKMAEEAPKGTLVHTKRRERAKGLRQAVTILTDEGVY